MKLPQDFKEFIELLNKHNVKYLLVEGYAVSYYSQPKLTQDIDIWVESSNQNAKKILEVLKEFGFSEFDIQIQDLTLPNQIIQLGHPPMRIDILTTISGVDFEEAYKAKIQDKYLEINVDLISIEDLVKNKEKAGRDKDQFDLKWMKKYGEE